MKTPTPPDPRRVGFPGGREMEREHFERSTAGPHDWLFAIVVGALVLACVVVGIVWLVD